MESLQSAGRDIQLQIAHHLAQAPSTSTAWLPAVRSLGSTNKYFRKLLTEANWLAPADVCEAKFLQAVRFTCPALRVLDLAEHFAPALPMPALKRTLQTLPRTSGCPDNSALPLMILNRAGERLQPATKAELVALVENSRYALPVDGDTQRWTFTEQEGKALKHFISGCIGLYGPRDSMDYLAAGRRYYFAEDCMDLILGLPNGLKALALHEVANYFQHWEDFPPKAWLSGWMDIMFNIDSLIPQQWNSALTDSTCFPINPLPSCLNSILAMANDRTVTDICRQVVKLVCNYLATSPEENRHWTRLQNFADFHDLELLHRLVRLLGTYTAAHGTQAMFLEATERSGLITAADLQSPQAMKEFTAWYRLGYGLHDMLLAILRRQAEESDDS